MAKIINIKDNKNITTLDGDDINVNIEDNNTAILLESDSEDISKKITINLEKGATVRHYKFLKNASNIIDTTTVNQKEYSKYSLFILDKSFNKISIHRTITSLLAKNTENNINCFSSGKDSNFTYNIETHHTEEISKSTQTITALVENCIYNAYPNIIVDYALKDVFGDQYTKILTSGGSTISASPILDVSSNHAICNHGLAIGQIEEEVLKYLNVKGLTKEIIMHMIQDGLYDTFLSNIIDKEVLLTIDSL